VGQWGRVGDGGSGKQLSHQQRRSGNATAYCGQNVTAWVGKKDLNDAQVAPGQREEYQLLGITRNMVFHSAAAVSALPKECF